MGINNPLPSNLSSECKKCGKILTSFIDPRQAFGPDKVIPPAILANAKGLAILTVIKAGFLGSARFGSGLVVARLPSGEWSAPSAIMTAGGGFGGQIGFELTDFVFILNDHHAVKTFSQQGSITLGGNVSIAAGPVGRNAEAAGAASLKSVSGVFSYSKTKGLFAGVSLEGSAIVERRDANEKLYGQRYTASQLLNGVVRAPSQASPLMGVLDSRVFSGLGRTGSTTSDMYNDVPIYGDRQDDAVYGQQQPVGSQHHPSRTNTWNDDIYDAPPSPHGINRANTMGSQRDSLPRYDQAAPAAAAHGGFTNEKARPPPPKPNYAGKANMLKKNEAIALFNFEADQPGDLGFQKGDVITVLKKTESDNDWWTGMIGTKHGIFPSNYVKMKE